MAQGPSRARGVPSPATVARRGWARRMGHRRGLPPAVGRRWRTGAPSRGPHRVGVAVPLPPASGSCRGDRIHSRWSARAGPRRLRRRSETRASRKQSTGGGASATVPGIGLAVGQRARDWATASMKLTAGVPSAVPRSPTVPPTDPAATLLEQRTKHSYLSARATDAPSGRGSGLDPGFERAGGRRRAGEPIAHRRDRSKSAHEVGDCSADGTSTS